MKTLASLLIATVAAIHFYIVVLEMLLWQKPLGRRIFRTTPEQAKQTATLAANQGLYNGFLAAGLAWALLGPDHLRQPVATFFLICVAVAGVFGAATVSRRILYVQTLPAALALLCLALGGLAPARQPPVRQPPVRQPQSQDVVKSATFLASGTKSRQNRKLPVR